MSWTTKDRRAHNTTTGARNMREHRAAKRKQAEARNALTPTLSGASTVGIRIRTMKTPEYIYKVTKTITRLNRDGSVECSSKVWYRTRKGDVTQAVNCAARASRDDDRYFEMYGRRPLYSYKIHVERAPYPEFKEF